MASQTAHASLNGGSRRDRAWLIPSNRRLRHLQSISIRNVSLSNPVSRRRGKTIDDEALPYTLKSPAKIVALREGKQLAHSRSSTDLRPVNESAVSDSEAPRLNGSPRGKSKGTHETSDSPKTPPRPPFPQLRRRSTLEWANASPQRRQEKLESVTAERLVDVFFSLHVEGVKEPVYVSETVEKTMNPSFQHVDLSSCGPAITRLGTVTVNVWTKTEKNERWQCLLELSINLRRLQYIGKALENVHQPLSANAVIFQMTDGIFACLTELPAEETVHPFAIPPPKNVPNQILPTSSFDALLRLSKLDDSIQDALSTRDQIGADLESLLQANKQALADRDKSGEADDRLKTVKFAKHTVKEQLGKAEKQREEKRASLAMRRKLMAEDSHTRERSAYTMSKAKPEFSATHGTDERSRRDISNQRRRVCEDLQLVYRIDTIPKQSLAFTIQGLHLPNSEDLDAEPPDIISAALGCVAHVIMLLSFYLGLPLPYPVTPNASTSTIEDSISIMKTTSSSTKSYNDGSLRTYPLFSKGVPRFRFEYAVFLLNKDIEILLSSQFGVRVLDIRQTLPNLKYLLYVATAGEDELPTRKAGGVRGLLRADTVGVRGSGGASMPENPRHGSDDSTTSVLSALLWHNGNANGKPKGAVDSLKRNQMKQDSRLRNAT